MATTTDFTIIPADGWTLVASSPGYLKIDATSSFNWYVAIMTPAAVPAVSLKGLQHSGDAFEVNTPITGDVYVRVGKPNVIKVTAAPSSASSGGGTSDATAANQALQITQETAINTILGTVTASPTANTIADRLKTINTTLGALPLPTGAATAAKQPALGTAGSSSTDVLSVQGIASGTALNVGGIIADGSSDSGGGVKVAGLVNTGTPTARTTGQRQSLWLGGNGQVASFMTDSLGVSVACSSTTTDANAGSSLALTSKAFGFVFNGSTNDRMRGDTNGTVNQPYAMTSSRWQYAAASGGISNTTTAVTFIAAAGTSVRNYVTAIQIHNSTLGAATEIAIRDGAAGTVLWRGYLNTAGGTTSVTFPVPLKGTANTLMEVVTLTATVTGAVYFNAQGFQGT